MVDAVRFCSLCYIEVSLEFETSAYVMTRFKLVFCT